VRLIRKVKQTEKALTVFSHHNDADFQKGFEELVKTAYSDLFSLHKDAAWTFQVLAGFAGHGTPTAPSAAKPSTTKPKAVKPKPEKPTTATSQLQMGNSSTRDFGLTLRIEVNLPVAGDQETYDRIFRSIRENLLNVKQS